MYVLHIVTTAPSPPGEVGTPAEVQGDKRKEKWEKK